MCSIAEVIHQFKQAWTRQLDDSAIHAACLQAHFGQPGGQKTGCGFPVAHCLALVHAATGLVPQWVLAPLRTHDLSLVSQ